jgi:hypothetical protein
MTSKNLSRQRLVRMNLGFANFIWFWDGRGKTSFELLGSPVCVGFPTAKVKFQLTPVNLQVQFYARLRGKVWDACTTWRDVLTPREDESLEAYASLLHQRRGHRLYTFDDVWNLGDNG